MACNSGLLSNNSCHCQNCVDQAPSMPCLSVHPCHDQPTRIMVATVNHFKHPSSKITVKGQPCVTWPVISGVLHLLQHSAAEATLLQHSAAEDLRRQNRRVRWWLPLFAGVTSRQRRNLGNRSTDHRQIDGDVHLVCGSGDFAVHLQGGVLDAAKNGVAVADW